jgi:hypothetical protein
MRMIAMVIAVTAGLLATLPAQAKNLMNGNPYFIVTTSAGPSEFAFLPVQLRSDLNLISIQITYPGGGSLNYTLSQTNRTVPVNPTQPAVGPSGTLLYMTPQGTSIILIVFNGKLFVNGASVELQNVVIAVFDMRPTV